MSLRKLFDSFSVSAMKNILKQHPDLKAMSAYIQDENSGQTLGVTAELQQLVREIFIGSFKQNGSLSVRDLVRNKGGRVVFIEYDLSIGSVLTPIYKLLFDLAIKEALCRTENEGNVFFLMDEFRLLPHLQHIDNGVNFGRSLGAKFIVGVQNIDQIAEAYGDNLAQRRSSSASRPSSPSESTILTPDSTSKICTARISKCRPICPQSRTAGSQSRSVRAGSSRTRTSPISVLVRQS